MPKITDISPQKKNKTRVNIFIDNKFYCGLENETLVKARLKTGSEIIFAQLDKLIIDSEKTSAFNRAIKYLSGKMKTEHEIKVYLEGKGYMPQAVEYCIEKLKEYRYIDDAHYADLYAGHAIKSGGRMKLKYDMRRKNIDEDLIEETLGNISEEDELASAQRIAEKYMRNKENTKENNAKLYRYLNGKGFSSGIIKQVIRYDDED